MHSHLAKMIGNYIYESRQKKHILQYELAKDLDITAQFLGRVEKGDVMIPHNLLLKSIKLLDLKQEKLKRIYRSSGDLTVSDMFSKKKARPLRKRKKALNE